MRRITLGLVTFLVLTGTLLVVPVYAAPAPDAEPVAPSIEAVELGSVATPEDEAVVTTDGEVVDAGPQAPASAAPTDPALPDEVASSGEEIQGVPALTVSQPDTDPFSSVGVTWTQDAGVTGVTVQLRTKGEDGVWTGWTTVDQDDVDPAAGDVDGTPVRSGTAPTWAGPSRGVEVIVQAADGRTPSDVQLQLIDPGTSDADTAPGPPAATAQADAAMAMPAIYSRAQWGADESIMGWDQEFAPTITSATVHHTADSNDYTASEVPAIMRSIYAYHAVSRGWGDIGYNVIVDKFGRAWEGRSGGLSSTVVGAHAGGFNYGTFGISMLGNYDTADTTPALINTVSDVIAWKFSLYGVNAGASTMLTSAGGGTSRFPAGVATSVPTIFGHRDVGSTTCPGRYGYARMGEIRSQVAAKMANPALRSTSAADAPQSLLRNSNSAGDPEQLAPRGDIGDVPIACDWNGDGTDSISIFRRGRWFAFDSNAPDARVVAEFGFGDAGDRPLCGDWDGDGKDSIGVWRRGFFFLRNDLQGGNAQGFFAFGNTNAQPAVGNWDGDPFDTVGVYQGNVFYFTNSNLRPVANGQLAFGAGSDRVVVGDWTARGRDSIGVFRSGTYYLTNALTSGATDATVRFGSPGDRAFVGDWNGDRTDTVGAIRGY